MQHRTAHARTPSSNMQNHVDRNNWRAADRVRACMRTAGRSAADRTGIAANAADLERMGYLQVLQNQPNFAFQNLDADFVSECLNMF